MKSIAIIIILLPAMLIPNNKYKEPNFRLIDKHNNIEIRQYSKYIVARTTAINTDDSPNNMFRTLASYIFGQNKAQKNIPMTAPVTTFKNKDSYEMLFYMLDVKNIEELPEPLEQNIVFEEIHLNKCAVISFSWFTYDKKIKSYQNQLKKFLDKNGYTITSQFMLNRYDPPWRLPFMRRNEVLVQIQ